MVVLTLIALFLFGLGFVCRFVLGFFVVVTLCWFTLCWFTSRRRSSTAEIWASNEFQFIVEGVFRRELGRLVTKLVGWLFGWLVARVVRRVVENPGRYATKSQTG